MDCLMVAVALFRDVEVRVLQSKESLKVEDRVESRRISEIVSVMNRHGDISLLVDQ